ncbi:MAG: hypothetical protein ACRCST_04295 [Turicibacter sp.]
MRKYLLAGITVLSLGSMMGCSVTNQTDFNQDSEKDSVIMPEEELTETPVDENTVSVMSYFGKVETVIGNEVSLKLADQPDMEGVVLEEGNGLNITSIGEVGVGVTEAIGSTITMTEGSSESFDVTGDGGAIFNEGDMMVAVPSGEGEGNLEDVFANIEYSGESKSIVVPAGVEIFNFKTGKDGKLTDIKEGSILMMYADANTNTVTRIEIMA